MSEARRYPDPVAIQDATRPLTPLAEGRSQHSSSPLLSFQPLEPRWSEHIAEIDREWNPRAWGAELFRSELTNDRCLSYGAFVGRGLVGYVLSHVIMDESHIVSFGIAAKYQGNGFGRQLLRHLLGRLTAQGVRTVTLEVRVSNLRARALYESEQFMAVGIRKRYYSDNQEDALTMKWEDRSNNGAL